MANKKISQLPYIGVSKISGNTLVPLVTYFSGSSGDTVHTYVSDLQAYIISGITGNTSVVGNYLPLSGGTVTGSTIFTNGLTANTISATTYQNLPQFSGGSGNCIADLFVSNIHSCSPLYINPLNEGDVYFGSVTSGVTFDISNSRIGIGTLSPQYTLDLKSSSSNLILNTSSTGNTLQLSGNTQLPRFGVIVSPYLTKPVAIGSMGIRAWNDSTYAGYGKVGDMHIYASSSSNGLNIINQGPGTSTDDYIRFYAGQDALGDDPDIHIQGSGSTRGYVGVGTKTPTERLDVSGKTKTINFQMTSGSTAGYVLTAIDSSGNARWQVSSGGSSTFTGGTVSGATSFTNGLSANTISATTYQNLPVSGLTAGTNISITNTSGNHTISVTGITGGSSINPYNNSGSGSTISWDVSGVSTNYEATLTATTTLNLTNVRNGDFGTIIIKQDSVGSRTLTLGSISPSGTHRVANGGGGITLTSNPNAIDILTFTYNGSIMFWTVGNDYA